MEYELVASWVGVVRLVFFMALFFGILLWIFRPGAKKNYNEDAQIVLKEDN